jgi:hypothetical protein
MTERSDEDEWLLRGRIAKKNRSPAVLVSWKEKVSPNVTPEPRVFAGVAWLWSL